MSIRRGGSQGPLGLIFVKNDDYSHLYCCNNDSVQESGKVNYHRGHGRGIFSVMVITTAMKTAGGANYLPPPLLDSCNKTFLCVLERNMRESRNSPNGEFFAGMMWGDDIPRFKLFSRTPIFLKINSNRNRKRFGGGCGALLR